MNRTIEDINRRAAMGEAVVLTAKEVAELVEAGKERELREVDVVTTGTMGLMSGTYAVLSFPVAPPGKYRRFANGTINGIPVAIGPCPNEGLGLIDAMVFGTTHSRDRPNYGAGHLFRDLVEGQEVEVSATTDEGQEVRTDMHLDDIKVAKLMSTRNVFRNYRAIVNPSDQEVTSIFHSRPFPPRLEGLTFSGCGHVSPLQNDPDLRTVGVGTRLLFNGAEGFVTSGGTRSSVADPNLMTIADMRSMDPTLMGGFLTAAGPECICSYALPIPMIDQDILTKVMTRDLDIPLPVVSVLDRRKIADSNYGQVWDQNKIMISTIEERCAQCELCSAEGACPTGAITRGTDGPSIDPSRCFSCGTCTTSCPQGCFAASLGQVRVIIEGRDVTIPVICRQSNMAAALRTAGDLKGRILDGSFTLTSKVADIRL